MGFQVQKFMHPDEDDEDDEEDEDEDDEEDDEELEDAVAAVFMGCSENQTNQVKVPKVIWSGRSIIAMP
jgi:hypothetical protein